MKTLLVNNEKAFETLGEYAGLYGDNGGVSDGNAWMPSEPLDASDVGVAEVVAAQHGQIVTATYTNLSNILEDVRGDLKTRLLLEAEQAGRDDGLPTYADVCDVLNTFAPPLRWAGFLNGATIVISY
jgi:hypothetical protein